MQDCEALSALEKFSRCYDKRNTISSLDELAGPEGKDDRLLCPVRALRYYLQRSNEYRS